MHPCAQCELRSWVTHTLLFMQMILRLPHACCTAPACGSFVSDLVGLSPAPSSGTAPRTDAALDTVAAHHQDQQARAEAEREEQVTGTGIQVATHDGSLSCMRNRDWQQVQGGAEPLLEVPSQCLNGPTVNPGLSIAPHHGHGRWFMSWTGVHKYD